MSKQNTGRKFFATAATAALVASAIVPVASAAEFTDAEKIASWATEAVEALAANEVISGNPDGSFNPTGTVTRAEAAKMFTVALGLNTEGTETFADVKDGQWFQEYVVAVVNAGIVNGMTTTEFAPNGKLTREQAAKMIVEAYGLEGQADLSTFADAKSVAGKWSEGYLATAVENGIIAGKGDKLAATDSISRQEFAVMLNRAITGADTTEADKAAAVKAVEEATASLETATKALSTEVATDKIAEAKVAVAAAKAATTKLEEAVKAATELEAITEEQAKAATEATAKTAEALKVTEAAIAKAEEAAKVLAVESVKGLSATQVEVKFTKAVAKESVIDNGKVKSGVITLTELADAAAITEADLTATLSEDGKTLVVTAKSGEKFEGRYDIVIDGMKDKASKAGTKFEAKNVEFAKDTTAPTVVGTERVSATQVKVKFSEPVLFAEGTITADTKDVKIGDTAIASAKATAAVSEVVINLSADSIEAGKEVKLTLNGVEDVVGNLINPQPTTVVVKKEAIDTVAPSIKSVTQTGTKTFTITFDKAAKLTFTENKAEVEVSGSTVTGIEKVSDTEYKVTVAENLKGLQKVTVKAGKATNVDAQASKTDLTKTITFVADEKAPVATSKLVTVEGIEYLQLTFEKDVVLEGNKEVIITGSYVDNYVTTKLDDTKVEAKYADAKEENKKVVLLPLEGKLAVKGATYDVKVKNSSETKDSITTINGIATDATVEMEEVSAKFTRGENNPTAETNTEVVSGVSVAAGENNDQVTVTFEFKEGFKLDGATATNPGNYVVNGANVESVTLKGSDKTTQTVTLNLEKDSNKFTGTRNVTVKNVKVEGSTEVMKEVTVKSAVIKENERPTLSSAVVTEGKEITLTFSESISSTNAEAFVVKVGGVAEAELKATAKDGNVVIVLKDALTNEELAKAITVEPTKTTANFIVKDAAGNLLEKFEVKAATIAAE